MKLYLYEIIKFYKLNIIQYYLKTKHYGKL